MKPIHIFNEYYEFDFYCCKNYYLIKLVFGFGNNRLEVKDAKKSSRCSAAYDLPCVAEQHFFIFIIHILLVANPLIYYVLPF
jgi:hypothetical protein